MRSGQADDNEGAELTRRLVRGQHHAQRALAGWPMKLPSHGESWNSDPRRAWHIAIQGSCCKVRLVIRGSRNTGQDQEAGS